MNTGTLLKNLISWLIQVLKALCLKLDIFPQDLTDDQETSYIEHTQTLGYTLAFKYENVFSSSSLLPSSQSKLTSQPKH